MRTSSSSDGHVFEVQGNSNVVIKSSGDKKGLIKGGYAENGGGINVHDGSTLTLNNVAIEDNSASSDKGLAIMVVASLLSVAAIAGFALASVRRKRHE